MPRVFHDFGTLAVGDTVLLEDAPGRSYAFEVYDRMTIEPDDT